MKKDIPTKYDPHAIEERIFKAWTGDGAFGADENSSKPPYSIVIPPPNVTGILHMGHALNNTIQDILVRWNRMRGKEAMWMPGTDHAGIATQNVVERKLAGDGVKRTDIGRDRFLEKVWEWKEEHGSTIIRQLKRLGCSCDWDRERFTMDEGLSKAVNEVFVRLFEEGLIYKGNYIINWCPRCTTALSDEEAEHSDLEGMFYHIKYPIKGREKLEKEGEDFVTVATTRPETLLGDVAIAVNPADKRYEGLRDKTVILPIVGRELKIIFDEDVDPEVGTGCLKVTPAHDPVDFELGIKHGLQSVNVMAPDGTMNELAGEDYQGLDRFECRENIVEDLKRRGLFVKAVEHVHAVGHCYRCHTIVEPRLSKQWFVKMEPLAAEAIKVVNDGQIKFYPKRWTKVYLNWMENIRDWCISRQIWWGHRIPVWYCKGCLEGQVVREVNVDGPEVKGVFVGAEHPAKCPHCGGTEMERDPDVLDTWFSSWLWPFSTMGWPEETGTLKKFYPTDALVTAQEIIFFWVARMIMSGLKFMGEIPFKDVYIHGTVRDATGTKMSKSLGNVIDPLDVISEVGSDALRYSIISITSQGQDVFLSRDKFDIGRNFANKLWNASRYVLMNIDKDEMDVEVVSEKLSVADKWILTSLNDTIDKVSDSLSAYRFNDAAAALYDFIWHKYCDWYLEITKLVEDRDITEKVLISVLRDCLKLLHPFMPFITEEIWQMLPLKEKASRIMSSVWPEREASLDDPEAMRGMETVISAISSIRNVRSFWNIGNKAVLDVHFKTVSVAGADIFGENRSFIEKLAKCRVRSSSPDTVRPERSVAALVDGNKLFIPIGEAIDVDKEMTRINGKIDELEKYLAGVDRKLSNEKFLANAPEEVINKEKAKRDKFSAEAETLRENIAALG